jgi:hypothetical protein
MAKQIQIELPETGKVAVSVICTETCIFAIVGDLTYDGDIDMFGAGGLEARVANAVQEALSSQLLVDVTFGNVSSTGDFNM